MRFVAIGFALLLCSCASFESGAQTTFARAESCPAERVTAHERADFPGNEYGMAMPYVNQSMQPLSPEVAANPSAWPPGKPTMRPKREISPTRSKRRWIEDGSWR